MPKRTRKFSTYVGRMKRKKKKKRNDAPYEGQCGYQDRSFRVSEESTTS